MWMQGQSFRGVCPIQIPTSDKLVHIECNMVIRFFSFFHEATARAAKNRSGKNIE
jgi:hypothetical protein